MAAISISAYQGWASSSFKSGGGFSITDYTIGTQAPSASFDFEVRYNTTDANSKAVTKEDIILFLKGVMRKLEEGGLQLPAGTFIITAPPL